MPLSKASVTYETLCPREGILVTMKAHLRICPKGHRYYKSSDCPTCPVCEEERKPAEGFLSSIAAPARRALEREGIFTLEALAKFTEQEILSLHGVGPSTLPRLRAALAGKKLCFRR